MTDWQYLPMKNRVRTRVDHRERRKQIMDVDGRREWKDVPYVDHVLEKRVHNMEVAVMGMAALLEDTLPVAYADDLGVLINAFYQSSLELGAFQTGEMSEH